MYQITLGIDNSEFPRVRWYKQHLQVAAAAAGCAAAAETAALTATATLTTFRCNSHSLFHEAQTTIG